MELLVANFGLLLYNYEMKATVSVRAIIVIIKHGIVVNRTINRSA